MRKITSLQIERIRTLVGRIECSGGCTHPASEKRTRTAKKFLKVYVDKLSRNEVNRGLEKHLKSV